MGCGHHGLVKVISYSFSPNFSPHIPCPQHVSVSKGGASRPTRPNSAIIIARPLVHSSALSLSLSQTVWVCRELGVPLLSLTPLSLSRSRSRSCPPTVRLLTWPGVVLGPRAPVCVYVCCSPLPSRVIGGICVCLCLPVPLDAGGNRMREDQL